MRRTSKDPFYTSFQFVYEASTMSLEDINPGECHACVYDKEWYIENAAEVSNINQDFYFKFMNKNLITFPGQAKFRESVFPQ